MCVDKNKHNGVTPLIIASQIGHVPVVQAPLQARTDKAGLTSCTCSTTN